ncbi:DUF5067 domain-containing protein [Corynebacterium gallinarum]|uniref:DUF5067 domain-containing protein n=1 Tax=Corynebacterium gallinarum TaxID=2762214 RepID=A0A8I0HP83_9CORY|nr:DUF5067 domain-containing protein [Corynebacterium gallinarum]MBD8030276.1 DUF5067 domain-containing protein [Corynebacterium gallinarum]
MEKKKKGGCMKWGAIIVGILIVIGIISAVAGGGDDTSSTSSDSNTSSEAGAEQGANEGAEAEEKTEFQIGETYTGGKGLEVTLNSFQATSSSFGTPLTCGQVTYTNNTDEQVSFSGAWDWKAQNPAGVITDPTFSGSDDLSSGELAPGGTITGSICFDGTEPGEYRVTDSPTLSFSSDTATWVAIL